MAKGEAQKLLIGATGLPETSGANDVLAEAARAIASLAADWDNGQVAVQLKELNSVGQTQAAATSENTQAVLQNTVAQATSGGSTASSVGNTVWKVFRSGLGVSPVVNALVGLFGGSKQEPPPALAVYTRPPAIQFEGTLASAAAPAPPAAAVENPAPRGPQITIQVQAMDSRSFLDHSDEIARAVREAMLNSHSLNDVVSELS